MTAVGVESPAIKGRATPASTGVTSVRLSVGLQSLAGPLHGRDEFAVVLAGVGR